jgi:hypothetical protein
MLKGGENSIKKFFLVLRSAFFYFISTLFGCDGGNRTRNTAWVPGTLKKEHLVELDVSMNISWAYLWYEVINKINEQCNIHEILVLDKKKLILKIQYTLLKVTNMCSWHVMCPVKHNIQMTRAFYLIEDICI